jgi:SagB-type dehydrogenase family enzyme
MHAEAGRLLVDTPLAAARIAIHAPRLGALVAALVAPQDIAALTVASDLPAPLVRSCLRLLAAARIICPETGGTLAEERDTSLRQWQFHDLFFHARSRLGRHDEGFGGTFRFREAIPPLPAARRPISEDAVTLPRPNLAACAARDPPLTRVMERRRSHRRHGKQPITLEQLGEFLFRVARIKDVIPPDPAKHRFYETSRRPYPSGGATYDLELYLTIGRCEGLLPGLYHYDALGHRLCRISGLNKMTDLLMEGARLAAKTPSPPQVLITLTSRFQRLSWKYETIAYATTLKNVGVLYQTMYLVAGAMNLAPCALGGGHSDLFARATGNDYVTESSVGEFMLGTRDEDGPG